MQCPECEDKYKVTVAGKTFCANCGTSSLGFGQVNPSPIANTTQAQGNNPATMSVAPLNVSEPIVQASQPSLAPAPAQMPAPQAPMPIPAPMPAPQAPGYSLAPVQQIPRPMPAPQALMPTQPPVSQAGPMPAPQAPGYSLAPVQQIPRPIPAPQQPAAMPAQPPVPLPAEVPATTVDKPVLPQANTSVNDETAAKPSSQDSSAMPQITTMHDITAKQADKPAITKAASAQNHKKDSPSKVLKPTKGTERLGSEMSSLEGSDEAIFSDEQLKELSSQGADSFNKAPSATDQDPDQDGILASTAMKVIKPLDDQNIATINPFAKRLVGPDGKATTPEQIDSIIKNNSGSSLSMNGISAPAAASSNPTQPALAPPAPAQTNTAAPAKNIQQPPASPQPAAAKSESQSQSAQPKSIAPTKKTAGKVASMVASMAGVALLGFYVWQINFPNLALKVASSKAGINASLPGYLPSGWKISGDISASPGNISYQLASQDGSKKVSVSESRTDWDSQALAENYLQSKATNYTALQSQGLTIYMYNNQASWVNQGSWYRIEGEDNGLSRDQIIKMATSI